MKYYLIALLLLSAMPSIAQAAPERGLHDSYARYRYHYRHHHRSKHRTINHEPSRPSLPTPKVAPDNLGVLNQQEEIRYQYFEISTLLTPMKIIFPDDPTPLKLPAVQEQAPTVEVGWTRIWYAQLLMFLGVLCLGTVYELKRLRDLSQARSVVAAPIAEIPYSRAWHRGWYRKQLSDLT